jgi:hypothetical protein
MDGQKTPQFVKCGTSQAEEGNGMPSHAIDSDQTSSGERPHDMSFMSAAATPALPTPHHSLSSTTCEGSVPLAQASRVGERGRTCTPLGAIVNKGRRETTDVDERGARHYEVADTQLRRMSNLQKLVGFPPEMIPGQLVKQSKDGISLIACPSIPPHPRPELW